MCLLDVINGTDPGLGGTAVSLIMVRSGYCKDGECFSCWGVLIEKMESAFHGGGCL